MQYLTPLCVAYPVLSVIPIHVSARLFVRLYVFEPPLKSCLPRSRQMLQAAHVLAMDAKNLLDVVDGVRLRCRRVAGQGRPAARHEVSPAGS